MESGQRELCGGSRHAPRRSSRWRASAAGLALLLFASGALAQTGEAPPDSPSASEDVAVPFSVLPPAEPPTAAEVLVMPRPPTHGAPVWQYSEPDPKLWEWLKLKSGEWLKGEITVLRDDKLEFDSDELDELEIDWDDVEELRSPRINSYTFIGRRLAVGRGYITKEQVTVVTGAGIMNFPRNELLSIIPGSQREIDFWNLKLGASVSLRAGNTPQTDVLVSGRLTRRGAFARFRVDYRGNFGTVDGVDTVDNQKGEVRIDLFVWDRLFLTPLQLELFRDTFQNVALRISPGSGVGYEIVATKRLEWEVEATALYRRTQFVTVDFPNPTSENTFALGLATHFDWEVTRLIDLEGSYSASIAIPEAEDTNQHGELLLSVELNSLFDLDTRFIWDRTGNPAPRADGSVPLQDDYTLAIGLSIDL